MPLKIKKSLEKGKSIEKDSWNDNNKLNSLIHDCIIIEKNIDEIISINRNIKKCNINSNLNIKFIPEEDEINVFLNKIKLFGDIYYNKFSFKKCPLNAKEEIKYSVSGEKENILTKTGTDGNWMGVICEKELDRNSKKCKWKIKLLKTKYKNIMVGVAPIDFDINSSLYDNYGWNFSCYSSKLFSGPPHNYKFKVSNLGKVKDEILLIMNMEKRTLKFIIDEEDQGESYSDIPLDKPVAPIVFLYDKGDSVEICDY